MLPAWAMAAGRPAQPIDARLLDNALWMLRTYRLRVTAAREGGHNTHGDGTALDLVPAGTRPPCALVRRFSSSDTRRIPATDLWHQRPVGALCLGPAFPAN